MSLTSPAGGLGLLERVEEQVESDTPWSTILLNDPVNTFPYVIATCMRVLSCSKEQAEVYTAQVHYDGKSSVFHGTKQKCEDIAAQFSAAHLWASAEKSS